MASFMETPIVNFACSCGLLNPITKLYFCRHCLKLRCGFCVCHEVDSHFCSNCLENIPSSEARHKKNRCNSCFDCPCCQHTLSARAANVTVTRKSEDASKETETKDGGNTPGSRKMYYLACLACRWTTRDVGIPDQTVATGSWPEPEYIYQSRFQSILEHYQALVLQDKQEKQEYWRRKTPKQHKYPSLTDRTGLNVTMIRRQMGWADKIQPKTKSITIIPSVATDEVDDLPESIFVEKINLKDITTIEQRHGHPSHQPYTVNKLFPQHKSLWIKRSLRCRQCEHNVIKPEYHPGSIKYRIQLFASYHVPDVRLVYCDPLEPTQPAYVILKLSNPTMHDMTITIMDLPTADEESLIIEDLKKGFEKQVSIVGTPSLTMSRQPSLNEEARFVSRTTSGELELPDSSFRLNHRDDSAEFDEDVQVHQREESKFVVWRRSNKASVKLSVTPHADLQPGDDVVIGFTLQYTYVNTVTNTAEKKDPQTHALTSRVYVTVGQIVDEKRT